MRCFKCSSALSPNRNICIKCGQDVRLYKKLCYASNAYYNVGLNKAKVRDLTGAVNALKMSVGLDKTNIDARNLLGLVYFEMGETALALREWVVSNNLLKTDNEAAYFLKVVQGNPNKLDAIAGSIRKYNYALKYAKEDGTDLAIIQLKKIIVTNPKLIRAYQLLALLYINDGQYRKAESLLKKCLHIDKGNTTARRYLSEIRSKTGKKESVSNKTVKIPVSGGDDDGEIERVIVPVYTKSFSSYFITAVDVIIGLILGAALIFFIVVPGYKTKFANQYKEELLAYQTNVSQDKVTIAELEDTIDTLKAERDALEEELAEGGASDSEGGDGSDHPADGQIDKQYGYLINLLAAYASGFTYETDVLENARVIQADDTYSEEWLGAYEVVKTVYHDTAINFYETGYRAYESAEGLNADGDAAAFDKYSEAITYFEGCIGLNPDYGQAYAWLGVCQHHMGLTDKAAENYRYYLDNYSELDEKLTHAIQVQLDSITNE